MRVSLAANGGTFIAAGDMVEGNGAQRPFRPLFLTQKISGQGHAACQRHYRQHALHHVKIRRIARDEKSRQAIPHRQQKFHDPIHVTALFFWP
jgi:hypothetical protein